MNSLTPLSTRTAQPAAPLPSGSVQPAGLSFDGTMRPQSGAVLSGLFAALSAFRFSPFAFDATSSRKPWRPSGPASAGSTAPLPSGLVQPFAFRFSLLTALCSRKAVPPFQGCSLRSQSSALVPTSLVQPFAFDATSSRKPWRPSGPASAGSTAPLPSGLVQPFAFRFSLSAFLLSLLLLAFPSGASAATATNTDASLGWNTNSTGWNTVTGNAWSSVNGGTNTAVFTNTSGYIQVINPITIGGLTYSPAGTFWIYDSTINLGANAVFNVANSAAALTISSTIAGNYSLQLNGSGNFTLSGSNSYTGGTLLNSGGIYVLGNKNALGTGTISWSQGALQASTDLSGANAITNNIYNSGSGARISGTNNITFSGAWTNNLSRSLIITLSNNATLTLSGPIAISDTLAAAQMTLNASGNTVISGNISNGTSTNGSLTLVGSGTSTLSGSNSYTGETIIGLGGTIVLGNKNALGTGTVTWSQGILRASTDLSGVNAITNNFYMPSGSSSIFSGTNNITFSGAWTNNVSRTYTVNLSNNATLTFSGPIALSTTLAAAQMTLSANGNTVISGNISNGTSTNGSLALTTSGTGISTTLSGSNSYTGGTIINNTSGGVLILGNKNALGTGTISWTQGALQASTDLSGVNAITNNIYNTGATISGTNNITLSGAWTNNGAGRNIFSSLTNATLTLSGPIAISDTLAAATFTLNGTGRTIISGNISNGTSTSGSLFIGGTGTTTLTSSNSYTGGTTVQSTAILGNKNALGSGTISFAGGTLAASTDLSGANAIANNVFSGGNQAYFAGTNNITISGAWTNSGSRTLQNNMSNGATLTLSGRVAMSDTTGGVTQIFEGTGNTTISGNISMGAVTAGAAITKRNGNGTLTLSGSNSYDGQTALQTGVLNIRNNNALGATNSGTAVSDGAALQLQGGISIGAEALTLNGLGVGGSGGALRNISGNNTYGGLITLGSSIRINSDADLLQITNAGTITGGNLNLTLGGAGNISISSIIGTSGGGGLTKDGSGTATLSGVNTYGGTTTINGGTLAYGTNNVIAAGAVTINSGTFDIGAFSDTVGGVTLGSGTISGTGTLTGTSYIITSGGLISANLAGTSSTLTKSGTGIVTLLGTNTYTGNTTISAGVLTIAATTALPGWNTSGRFSVANGATLAVYNAVTDDNITNMVYGTTKTSFASGSAIGFDTTTANREYSLVLSNSQQGALGLTKTGANTLTLSGVNTYTGTTTVNNGTLLASSANALGASSGAITASGGILDLGGNTFLRTGTITFSGGTVTNGTLSNNTTAFAAQGGTVAAILAGSAGLTQSGAGTTTLATNNTYTGTTTISGGTLAYGINDAIVNANAVTVNGGTFDIGAFSDTVGAVTLASGTITGTTGVLTGSSYTVNNASGTTLISAILGGNGTLTKTGAGILSIARTDSLPGWSTSGRFSVASGSTLAVYNAFTDDNIATMVYGTTNFASGSSIGFDTTSGNRTYSLVLSNTTNAGGGALGLAKTGANTLTLTAANTYTGGTTINGGTLQLGNGGSTGSLASSGAIVNNGNITINRSNAVVQGTDFSSAPITGNGSFTQAGTGTTTFTAANTYTGTTTINGGTLAYGVNDAIADSAFAGFVTVTNGATFDIRSFSDTVGAVTLGGGTITGTTGVLTFNNSIPGSLALNISSGTNNVISANLGLNAANQTLTTTAGTMVEISGTISGGGGGIFFELNGPGTIILSGSNSFTSSLRTVAGYSGTLLLNNSNALGRGMFHSAGTGNIGNSTGAAMTFTNDINHTQNAMVWSTGTNETTGVYYAGNGAMSVTGGKLTLRKIDSTTSGRGFTYKAGIGTFEVKEAAGANMTGAVTLGSDGGGYTIILGNGKAFGTGSIAVNGIGTFQASRDLTGADAIANNWTFTAATGGSGYTFSGSNSIEFTGIVGANSGNPQLIINNIAAGKTLTFNNFALNSNSTASLTGNFIGSGATVITGTVSNGGGTTRSLTYSGTNGTLTLMGSNTYNGGTTLSAGTLRVGNNNALGTGTLTFNGGALSASDSVTARTLTNSILFLNNVTLGDSVNNAALTFTGTGNLGTTTRIITNNSAVTFAGVLSNTAGITMAGVGTTTLAAANTYTGLTTVSEGTLAYGINDAIVNANAVTVNGGTFDIGAFSDTVGAVTLGSGTISGTTGTLTGSSYTVTNASGNALISAILGGSGTLTKTGAGILSIARTNALPGWSTSGRFSVASGSTLAVYNAFTDDNIATMVYGTTNFAVGSAIGFDTATANREYSLVLSNTSRGLLGLTKTGANTLTLTAASTYTGTTTVNNGTLQLGNGGATGTLSTASTIVNNGNFAINRNNQVTQGTDFSSAPITGTGSFTQAGTGTTTLTAPNTYTGTTSINGGTLQINSGSAIGTNTVILANATFLSYIGSGVSSLNNAITVGSGTATIANSGGSTLTLGGTLAKNGTTLTLNGGSGGINVTGSITGANSGSDLVIGSGTVTLSGSNSYNGPTLVNNGATLNANSALPTANGASALLLDSTGSGGSTVNLGTNQTIASLSGASSSTVNLNARTLTINSGAGIATYAGSISGSGSLLKSGSLTQMLTGTSAYTGTTTVNGGALSLGTSGKLTGTTSVTVNAGSTLLLGSSVANSINTNATLNLGGGQLSMGAGSTRASSQTFNTLTLTANSSIDFANLTGLSSLYFSNISGLSTYTLSIFNYNGSNPFGASSSTGGEGQFTKLYAATGGAFASSLGNILFYGGSDANSSFLGQGAFNGGSTDGFTQIVPVPEPSVVIAALMLLAWLLYTNRGAMRRLIGC